MMISFNGANYVAQRIDFRMTEGWKQGNDAAEQWYRPEETFAERFAGLIGKIKALGFSAMDLWTAQVLGYEYPDAAGCGDPGKA